MTYWVYAWAWRKAYALVDGEVVEIDVDDSTHMMDIDPQPPKCIERHHIWRKDGQISLLPDGGSEKRYMCETCGVYNKVVTISGDEYERSVVSVSYEPADRDSVAWVVRNARRIWEATSGAKETA